MMALFLFLLAVFFFTYWILSLSDAYLIDIYDVEVVSLGNGRKIAKDITEQRNAEVIIRTLNESIHKEYLTIRFSPNITPAIGRARWCLLTEEVMAGATLSVFAEEKNGESYCSADDIRKLLKIDSFPFAAIYTIFVLITFLFTLIRFELHENWIKILFPGTLSISFLIWYYLSYCQTKKRVFKIIDTCNKYFSAIS